jgi:hypothetical protein
VGSAHLIIPKQISNSSKVLKFKTEAFPYYKNTQTLHEARFAYFEQVSP